MKLSVVIPARNEEGVINDTITSIYSTLVREDISHEILVVNDGSKDKTENILKELSYHIPTLRVVKNEGQNGFGNAVKKGIESVEGEIVAIMMADASDSPKDLITYYKTLIDSKCDAVFGSRFKKGGQVSNYPRLKLFINRIGNLFIGALFGIWYSDMTNAFKMYTKKTLDSVMPLTSAGFELTLEIPLKAIIRGARYKVVPNSWLGRKAGVSKFKLAKQVMGYNHVIFECFVEKYFNKKK